MTITPKAELTARITAALADAVDAGVNLDEPRTVTLAGDASWQSPAAEPGAPLGYHSGHAGDTVAMPVRAAIRLEVLGYLAATDAGQLVDALPADLTTEELDDLAALEEELDDDELPAGTGLAGFVPTGPDTEVDPDGTDIELDELLELGAPELVAHIGQFPGDAGRILAGELARGAKARITVLRAAGHDEDA